MRAQRKQLSPDDVAFASLSVSQTIIHLPAFLNSQHIAYYLPNENEIDTQFIAEYATELGKKLYLPVMSENNSLIFYAVHAHTQYQQNKLNIVEPVVSGKCAVAVDQLDLILIPLVAFDKQCHRLGRGTGCYDRALQSMHTASTEKYPVLIGLAYEFQKVETIIPEQWDVSLDCIVTEKMTY